MRWGRTGMEVKHKDAFRAASSYTRAACTNPVRAEGVMPEGSATRDRSQDRTHSHGREATTRGKCSAERHAR